MRKLYDWAVKIGFVKKLMKIDFFARLLSYEVVLYVFFGVVTTIINVGLYWLLGMFFGDKLIIEYQLFGHAFKVQWGMQISNFIAWVITILVAFVTNKLFVFESKSWETGVVGREFSSFVGARIFSLVVEQLGLFVLMDLISVRKMVSKAIIAVAVVVMNYFFSKFFIFKKKENPPDTGIEKETV